MRQNRSSIRGYCVVLYAVVAVCFSTLATAQFVPEVQSSQTCNVTPFPEDKYTALLDHFDSSTTGQVHGNVTFGRSLPGLDEAMYFHNGSWVVYPVSGWYSWTSDYNPSEASGAIELWIKRSFNHNAGDFLTINWYDTSTPPGAGYITHLGLDENGRLTFGGWSSITNNPFDTEPDPPHTIIPPGKWTHIAYVWGPNEGTSVYVNGSLEMKTSLNYYPALNSTVYLYLNSWGSNVLAAVDELRVSNISRATMAKCAD